MLNVAETTNTTSLPAGGSYASLTSVQTEVQKDKTSDNKAINSHLIPTNDTVHLSPKAKASVLFNQGFNVQEIADDLGITPQTVDSYLKLSTSSSTSNAEHASDQRTSTHQASSPGQNSASTASVSGSSNATNNGDNKTVTGATIGTGTNHTDQHSKSVASPAQDVPLQ